MLLHEKRHKITAFFSYDQIFGQKSAEKVQKNKKGDPKVAFVEAKILLISC